MATTYSNPIIPCFAADPSAICVDGTFFLVNSTFHIFPGLPIYASRNLKSWTHIGHAINRQSQLSLENAYTAIFPLDTGARMLSNGGLFAATIRHHKGTFYVICTNYWLNPTGEMEGQNFYVSTTDIWSSNWSDPKCYEWNGIDPSIFFDDDGRSYIQGNWLFPDRMKQPTSTIMQAEVDLSTGKLLTEIKEIWGGFAKYDTEGPHMYKKDGYYYLLVAEGGTFEHHMLSIARSKNIWGPYESYSQNPVLTADGKNEYITNVGHGDIFEDSYGQWWAVVLGVRNNGDGRFPLGRETFLTPVSWPKGEFPAFSQPKITMEVPNSTSLTLPPLELKQDPCVDNVYIRNAAMENFIFSSDCGNVAILASQKDLSAPTGTSSFVGKRQRRLVCNAAVIMLHDDVQDGLDLKAGLALYKDDYRHADIFYDYATEAIVFNMVSKLLDQEQRIQRRYKPKGRVEFQIVATDLKYEFLFRDVEDENSESILVGVIDSITMSGRDMTGTVFGVFASGSGNAEGTRVDFENFRIE